VYCIQLPTYYIFEVFAGICGSHTQSNAVTLNLVTHHLMLV